MLQAAIAEFGARQAGGLHQHRLPPAGDPGLHRDGGGQPGTVAEGAGPRQEAAERRPGRQPVAALPGRDAGQRRGHAPGRGGHRGRPLRPRRAAGAHPRPAADRHQLRQPERQRRRRRWLRQRPHRRHPVARLGHPVGGRPHARLLRHRGRGPQQRGGRVDRARAAEAEHPGVPLRQRQRAQHHPSVDGRGRRDGLRHLHRALRHRHHLGHLRPGLRHPLGPHLRRHVGRPDPQHPALQQVPGVRLRPRPGRGGRPEVRGGGRGHQLRLPGDRRHRHPADPAHRRHRVRARGEHALRRHRGRERHREGPPPGAARHRGARRQDQDHRGAHPRAVRQRLRGRADAQGRHARGVRRVEGPGLRVPAHGRARRGRGRQDRGGRPGLRRRCPRAAP